VGLGAVVERLCMLVGFFLCGLCGVLCFVV